ncbi:hypothetical protein [Endozoicomonas montiporae]|uniref:hypothetical protein n=1 Tax=Endozoicomonas montiporae TaxID=1027273 RepID=UPI00136425F9
MEIIEQMAQRLPDRILYISCNPGQRCRRFGGTRVQAGKAWGYGYVSANGPC